MYTYPNEIFELVQRYSLENIHLEQFQQISPRSNAGSELNKVLTLNQKTETFKNLTNPS